MPEGVRSHLFCWDSLADPLCFVQTVLFWTLWPTLSRLGQTYWTHLSIWKRPWKRAPVVSSGWFLARASPKLAQAGHKSAWVRTKLVQVGPQVI